MLPPFIQTDKGLELNDLLNYVKGGILVPSSSQNPIQVPAATSANNPGRITTIFEGSSEAFTEIQSMIGAFYLTGYCTITSLGGDQYTLNGFGTQFTKEMNRLDYLVFNPYNTNSGNDMLQSGYSELIATARVQTVNSDTDVTLLAAVDLSPTVDQIILVENTTKKQNLRVSITESATRRTLMNRPIPVGHVFGNRSQPGWVPESIWLRGQGILTMEFLNYNIAGGTGMIEDYSYTNVYPSMMVKKVQQAAQRHPKIAPYLAESLERALQLSPYWMGHSSNLADPIVLLAGSSTDVFYAPTRDINFTALGVWKQATFLDQTTFPTGDYYNKFSVNIFDAKTDRPLQNQAIPSNVYAGDDKYIHVLPSAILMEPNTQMRVKYDSLFATTVGHPDYSGLGLFTTFVGVSGYQGEIPGNTGNTLNTGGRR